MTRTSDNPRDRAIADEVQRDRHLMCSALNCPNPWTVDAGGGRLCSAHARVAPHLWPQVTQEQIDAQTQMALQGAEPKPAPKPVDYAAVREGMRQYLAKSRRQDAHNREWALVLRERERAGERLTQAQRAMWRAALSVHGHGLDLMPDVDPDALANARSLGTT